MSIKFTAFAVPELSPPTLRICTLQQLALAIQELENLLIMQGEPVKRPKSGPEPYNRTRYWGYAEDKQNAFLKLYLYCFALAKPP